jgi:hypothetical protein
MKSASVLDECTMPLSAAVPRSSNVHTVDLDECMVPCRYELRTLIDLVERTMPYST